MNIRRVLVDYGEGKPAHTCEEIVREFPNTHMACMRTTPQALSLREESCVQQWDVYQLDDGDWLIITVKV